MPFWSLFTLASLSCVAAIATVWAFFRVRKLLRGVSVRSLAALSNEVAELTSCFESLSAQQRKLSARVGMREIRERGQDQREAAAITGEVGDKLLPRSKLKEIARARGFKLT